MFINRNRSCCISRLLYLQVFVSVGCCISRLLYLQVVVSLGCCISRLLYLQVVVSLGCCISRLLYLQVAVSLGCCISRLLYLQVVVVSLGWCELAEEDLTSENSSRAVNRLEREKTFFSSIIYVKALSLYEKL